MCARAAQPSYVDLYEGHVVARLAGHVLVFQLESGRFLTFPARLADAVREVLGGAPVSALEQQYANANGTPRYLAREIVRAIARAIAGASIAQPGLRVDGRPVGRELGRVRAGDDRVPQPLGVARRRMRDDQQALWQ